MLIVIFFFKGKLNLQSFLFIFLFQIFVNRRVELTTFPTFSSKPTNQCYLLKLVTLLRTFIYLLQFFVNRRVEFTTSLTLSSKHIKPIFFLKIINPTTTFFSIPFYLTIKSSYHSFLLIFSKMQPKLLCTIYQQFIVDSIIKIIKVDFFLFLLILKQ